MKLVALGSLITCVVLGVLGVYGNQLMQHTKTIDCTVSTNCR